MLHVKITAQLTQLIAAFFPQRSKFEYTIASFPCVLAKMFPQVTPTTFPQMLSLYMDSHISCMHKCSISNIPSRIAIDNNILNVTLQYGLSFDLNIKEIIINLARSGIFTPSPLHILQFWEGKRYQSGGKREM